MHLQTRARTMTAPYMQQEAVETEQDEDFAKHQEMLQRHLQLLAHSSSCSYIKCAESCFKMRELIQHAETCPLWVEGECRRCRSVWLLLQYHAVGCQKGSVCVVPKCSRIKELLKQQDAAEALILLSKSN